jgi:alanine racemase
MNATSLNICTINLSAVEHNLRVIKSRLLTRTRIMAIVKALAYGTEDIRMASFLRDCGVEILGVAFVEEGVKLKRQGVVQEIFSINALPSEAKEVVYWDIQVGVSDEALVKALEEEAKNQQRICRLHLHIDTGMGRLGCRPEDALSLARKIYDSPYLVLEGIFTHFASSESPLEDHFTLQQYEIFKNIVLSLEVEGIHIPWKHAANSSAVLRHHLPDCNMVRIGLAMYGLCEVEAQNQMNLKLAISLKSRIVGINHCRNGESVGYGRVYRVEKSCERIAILPLGYFDGLQRHYSGKGYVLIHGKCAPMVGSICMDYTMVNITHIPDAKVGDEVLVFGHNDDGHYLSPQEFAAQVGSIPHELITCLGPRIKRTFVYQ